MIFSIWLGIEFGVTWSYFYKLATRLAVTHHHVIKNLKVGVDLLTLIESKGKKMKIKFK
jgi:hypothetical protein